MPETIVAPAIKPPPAPPPESFRQLAKRRLLEWCEAVDDFRATVKARASAKEIEAKIDRIALAAAQLPAFSGEHPARDHGQYAFGRMAALNRMTTFFQLREQLALHGAMGVYGAEGEGTDPAPLRKLANEMPDG